MNLEICEKCLNDKMVKSSRESEGDGSIEKWCIYKSFYNKTIIEMFYKWRKSPCGIVSCNMYVKNSNRRIKTFTREKFNKVELIDKDCPYYLEHCLYNWSKK